YVPLFAAAERGAFDKVMVDRNAAHIRLARLYGGLVQIVGRGDVALCVGGYRKLSGAIFRGRGELIEPREAVRRYTNDRGASGVKLVFHLRKCMRFEITPFGEGSRIEINDHRALFQRIRE